MIRVRYQIRFAKTGLLRWISHRDLARLWERLVRRAALQLSMTEGFHPKPRIAFPSALALGVEGLDEVVELELAEQMTAEALAARLRGDEQPGLEIRRVCQVPEGYGKAQLRRSHYAAPLPEDADLQWVEQAIDRVRSAGTVTVERKGKTVVADVAAQIPDLAVRAGRLEMTLTASRQASIKPTDLLAAMGLESLLAQGAYLIRTRCELEQEIDLQHCTPAEQALRL